MKTLDTITDIHGPTSQSLRVRPLSQVKGPVTEITFEDYVSARRGLPVKKEVRRLYRKMGAKSKPKRCSVGLIFRGRAYWWRKCYYQTGSGGIRPPLHHAIWAWAKKRPVPAGYQVVFRDGDRHNFRPSNLLCLTTSEVHRRMERFGNHYTRSAPQRLAAMLDGFQRKGKNDNSHRSFLSFLTARRGQTSPQVAVV